MILDASKVVLVNEPEMRRKLGLFPYRQVGTSPVERWYIAGAVTASDLIAGPGPVGVLLAAPHVFPCPVLIDKLSILVTGVNNGTNARLGVYESVGNFTDTTPGALVLDAGQVAINTTGVKTISGLTLSLLQTKLYYFCLITDTTAIPAAVRLVPRAAMAPILGVSTLFPQSQAQGWQGTMTYGTLPAAFPSPAVMVNDPPAIAMHFSA